MQGDLQGGSTGQTTLSPKQVQPTGQVFVSTISEGLISIVLFEAVDDICPFTKLGIIKLKTINKLNDKNVNFF